MGTLQEVLIVSHQRITYQLKKLQKLYPLSIRNNNCSFRKYKRGEHWKKYKYKSSLLRKLKKVQIEVLNQGRNLQKKRKLLQILPLKMIKTKRRSLKWEMHALKQKEVIIRELRNNNNKLRLFKKWKNNKQDSEPKLMSSLKVVRW